MKTFMYRGEEILYNPDRTISEFQGPFRFLSNFDDDLPNRIQIGSCRLFQSSEHAYMFFKSKDPEYQKRILEAPTAAEAKKIGKTAVLREDWEDIKFDVMYNVVSQKFWQMRGLRRRLLVETGYAELIEGNIWHDTIWGVCNGVGENHLGKILMLVREQLRRGDRF